MEAAGDVMYGRIVRPIGRESWCFTALQQLRFHDKCVKFGDPRLNHSRTIPPEAIACGILNVFCINFRQKVVSDVISGAAVGHVRVKIW